MVWRVIVPSLYQFSIVCRRAAGIVGRRLIGNAWALALRIEMPMSCQPFIWPFTLTLKSDSSACSMSSLAIWVTKSSCRWAVAT